MKVIGYQTDGYVLVTEAIVVPVKKSDLTRELGRVSDEPVVQFGGENVEPNLHGYPLSDGASSRIAAA